MKKIDYKLRCVEMEITEAEIILQDLLEHKVYKAQQKGFQKVNKLLDKLKRK